jgi:hypothetical protein
MVTWSIFKNHLLEVSLTQNHRPCHFECSQPMILYFILFFRVWRPVWIKIHWNSIWLRVRSQITPHSTQESMTTLHDVGGVLGRPLGTFLLDSHNLMVTALGSCVRWPLSHVGACCICQNHIKNSIIDENLIFISSDTNKKNDCEFYDILVSKIYWY